MKILSVSLLLLLAASVSQGRPRLTELLASTNIFENEAELLVKQRLSINYPYCRSWHLGVETSNIRKFKTVPANCKDYVEDYLTTSQQYRYDSKTVCEEAYFYAKGLALRNDTYNVWIFDLDDTLLSNVPFYAKQGYGTEKHDFEAFRKWLEVGEAPVLPETLHLYKNIQELGIEPILLTERFQEFEEVTLKLASRIGDISYSGSNMKTANFKSKERKKLEKSGHTIIGNIGDQWADLTKDSLGRRTFKLPNPLYYEN